MVNALDYDDDSASEDEVDICVSEWVQSPKSKPFACSP
jgi:hypothetical protein